MCQSNEVYDRESKQCKLTCAENEYFNDETNTCESICEEGEEHHIKKRR